MQPRTIFSLLFVLLTTAACGGGGGSSSGSAGAVVPLDFVHTVTNENAVGSATRIQNPLTFGRPDLVLLVTQNRSPEGTSAESNRSYVGVLYDAREGDAAPLGRWMILNMDISAEARMRAGMAFNVSIFEPRRDTFVHEVTRASSAVSHIASSGGPLHATRDTRVFVTQRLSKADGSFGATNRSPVLTHWTGSNWAIVNQNGRTMPAGAAFNVVLLAQGPTVDAFNTTTARSTLWYADTSLSENAILHLAQGPRDTRGGNVQDAALRYSSSRGQWGVVNVDGSMVAQYATFKLLIRRP